MINYYVISLDIKYYKSFIRYLLKNNIDVFDIKYKSDKILLKVSYESYKKIKGSNNYPITIYSIGGKNRFIYLFHKYRVSFICFFIGLFFIIFLSNLILFINIDSDNGSIRKLVKDELNSNDITVFTFKRNYQTLKSLSKKIKNNNLDKLEWIEFDQNGVFLNVRVIERVTYNNKEKTSYKDVIASKNGYIRNIVSSKGMVLKNIDDYVNKGDIIISGNIYRNDKVVGHVRASGDVYAEVWYISKSNGNLYYYDYVLEKKGRLKLVLKIGRLNICIISIPKKVDNESSKTLFSNNSFSLILDSSFKYKKIKKKYSSSDLENILKIKAKREIASEYDNNEYIIDEKTLKKYIKNDKMYIEIFFRCYENIAELSDIKNLYEEKED